MSHLKRHQAIVSKAFREALAISDPNARDAAVVSVYKKLNKKAKRNLKPIADRQSAHWALCQQYNKDLQIAMNWPRPALLIDLLSNNPELATRARKQQPELFNDIIRLHRKYDKSLQARFAREHIEERSQNAGSVAFYMRHLMQ